ncbi:MAG: helix-turn-helix domain-containing protein [Leadbetterella sp.]
MNQLPHFRTINEFLTALGSPFKSVNPDLFCFKMDASLGDAGSVMAPFRKDFYFVSIITNSGQTKIGFDGMEEKPMNSFMVCQSPGHIYSWQRDKAVLGRVIYFAPEILSFFRPDLQLEFPYFNIKNTSFFQFSQKKYDEFESLFDDIFVEYELGIQSGDFQSACLKLLVLLYKIRDFSNSQKSEEFSTSTSSSSPQIYQQYLRLIDNYYIEKRTVKEYADLLNVNSHYLSQVIKQTTDKNALTFINDRLLKEAKILIKFTQKDIAEISYLLNFSDPANFGKFFKMHTQLTPKQFREAS